MVNLLKDVERLALYVSVGRRMTINAQKEAGKMEKSETRHHCAINEHQSQRDSRI